MKVKIRKTIILFHILEADNTEIIEQKNDDNFLDLATRSFY